MATLACRPRSGRIVVWLVIALMAFVFLGLAYYHFRRSDQQFTDARLVAELAKQTLPAVKTSSAKPDWPRWRGPNRDGVSTETNILTTWPTDGPKELWRQPIGIGYSSVAIAKGQVVTMFQEGESEVVAAWNATSGEKAWQFRYPAFLRNDYGDGPRATPTIEGDFVYTLGGTGILHCLKPDLKMQSAAAVWSVDLVKVFGARTPIWGFAHSPLVDGDRIYIMPGGSEGNGVAALDKKTGAILWKKHDDDASYSSPMIGKFSDQQQVLFLTGSRLLAVSPDTGEKLWDFAWHVEKNCSISTPIIVGDYVFLSSGYGKGCAVLKVEKVGNDWRPALVYSNRRMRNHFSTSVLHDGHIYGFDDSNLACMNFHTGDILWKERGFDKGSLLLVNGHLIIYGANGILASAEATPAEYKEISRFTFAKDGRSCWAVPVLADGRLYVRDRTSLVCLEVALKR